MMMSNYMHAFPFYLSVCMHACIRFFLALRAPSFSFSLLWLLTGLATIGKV